MLSKELPLLPTNEIHGIFVQGIIKPPKGDFLQDYQNHGNLHIAVTNSKGYVVEYDMEGIHKDRTSEWGRCIVIDIVRNTAPNLCLDPDWSEYWDFCLENTLKRGKIQVTEKEKTADSTNH